MKTRSGTICLATLAAAALLAAGCGGSDDEESTDGGGSATEASAVTIADFNFDPPEITVPAGSEVTFTNTDSAAHTATADDDSFDTGSLEQDAEGSVTLDEAGTFSYFCEFHPTMKGTVEVE